MLETARFSIDQASLRERPFNPNSRDLPGVDRGSPQKNPAKRFTEFLKVYK